MKLILRYTLRYKRFLLLSLLGVGGFVLIQLGIPTILKYILNDAVLNANQSLLYSLVLLMAAMMLVGFAGEICMSFANARIATNVIRDIRTDLFAKTQSFSHSEFNQFSVSSLITSTTSDAYQIMIFLQQLLRVAIITPVMTVTGFWMIVNTNPSMLITLLALTPILMAGVVVIGHISHPYSKKQQKTLDKINLTLREGLTGLRVIRAFRNEDFQNERFDKVNETYCGVSRRVFRIMSVAQPAFFLIFSILITVVIWVSSTQMQMGNMQVADLTASIEYIFHILFTFMLLSMLFVMYPRAAVSAERISAVLDSKPSISENLEHGVIDTEKKGYVEFQNVTFAYSDAPEEAVIKNISFTAEPGETVAFIGSTGSGKSTLIQLIPRMFDVTHGKVLVNGIDVRDYNIHALREKIGFIPQKAQLFSGTIAQNLRLGKADASSDDLKRAAQIAQAADFIAQKADGYDEMLAEGGSNLSGGQKQRLAIARAIVKSPEIYIFDDSFSALDYATDLKLCTQLKKNIKDATVLIVAQRVGTIMNADKILVLNEGCVIAQGTHHELLKTCSIYYDIAASQLSKEELA